MTDKRQTLAQRVTTRLTHKRITGILVTLLLVGLGSYYFEEIKDLVPDLALLQLQVFDWLTRIQARHAVADKVIGVEVDDASFFQCLGLNSEQDVTDRGFLAVVVNRAVDSGALVIALDINLAADAMDKSDRNRMRGNRALFGAFARARARDIPVVITQGFDYKTMTPLGNIQDGKDTIDGSPDAPLGNCRATDFRESLKQDNRPPVVVFDCLPRSNPTDGAGPYRARAGFDLEPEDKRKAPLIAYTDSDIRCPSFALQVASAYQDVKGQPSIMKKLAAKTEGGQRFVFVSFLPEYSHLSAAEPATGLETALDDLNTRMKLTKRANADDQYQFPHVSARTVYEGTDADALAKLTGRIVLIGGHRHATDGGQDWLDYHLGPAGPMVGMYIHANYIEGLLDQRIQLPISRRTGVYIDLGIAIFVIAIELLWVEHSWQRFFVFVVGAVLLVLCYKTVLLLGFGHWPAIGIDLLLTGFILIAGLWAEHFRRRMIVMFLAFCAVALTYAAASLLGYSVDVLAVLVILIFHDLYDHHLQRQQRLATALAKDDHH